MTTVSGMNIMFCLNLKTQTWLRIEKSNQTICLYLNLQYHRRQINHRLYVSEVMFCFTLNNLLCAKDLFWLFAIEQLFSFMFSISCTLDHDVWSKVNKI